jgi:TetR/AcrR family transcriptional repressor of nem operon
MARRREFDYDLAIERATLLFWKKGYTNTSLRELLTTMGIGEGSFYSAVKSKKNLFLLCLEHYRQTVSRRRIAALTSGDNAKEGVRAFFRVLLDELDEPGTPRVCLLAGSLAADVLGERSLKRIVVRDMNEFVDAFTERLRQARESGEYPGEFDAAAVAQFLVTYLQGLFRVMGVIHNRAQVERQVDTLLFSLKL